MNTKSARGNKIRRNGTVASLENQDHATLLRTTTYLTHNTSGKQNGPTNPKFVSISFGTTEAYTCLASGDVVITCERDIQESLIIAQIEVSLAAWESTATAVKSTPSDTVQIAHRAVVANRTKAVQMIKKGSTRKLDRSINLHTGKRQHDPHSPTCRARQSVDTRTYHRPTRRLLRVRTGTWCLRPYSAPSKNDEKQRYWSHMPMNERWAVLDDISRRKDVTLYGRTTTHDAASIPSRGRS